MVIKDFKIIEKVIKPVKIYNIYHFRPVEGFSIDSRKINKNYAFIALKGRHKDGHDYVQKAVERGANFIIAQKPISTKPKVPVFVVADSYGVLYALVHYIRKKQGSPVYAVSGSLGKTTTKEMLSFLLKEKQGVRKTVKTENNILGIAKTFFSLKEKETVIAEVGTNFKGEIRSIAEAIRPDVGIITFVKPAHLEGLKDKEGILKEKLSLLECSPDTKGVLNGEDTYLCRLRNRNNIYWFGKNRDNDLYYRLIKRKDFFSYFLFQDKYEVVLPLYREKFILNAAAALLAAYVMGHDLQKMAEKISGFDNFPRMRMEMEELADFLVLNDAYNSNPYSLQEALSVLRHYPYPKIAVIGDMLELAEKTIYYHKKAARHLGKEKFEWVIFMGSNSKYTQEELRDLGYKNTVFMHSYKKTAEFIKNQVRRRNKSGKRYLLFLKGSRNMGLERVIEYLK